MRVIKYNEGTYFELSHMAIKQPQFKIVLSDYSVMYIIRLPRDIRIQSRTKIIEGTPIALP